MNRRLELTNLGGAGPVVGCAPLCRGRVPGIGFDAPGRRLVALLAARTLNYG